MGKDQKALLAILDVCAACTIDAVEKRRAPRNANRTPSIPRSLPGLKLDMAKHWQPSVGGYFGRVPKGLILDAVREGVGKPAADNIATLKKDAMADRAAKLLAGKNWLPAILR